MTWDWSTKSTVYSYSISFLASSGPKKGYARKGYWTMEDARGLLERKRHLTPFPRKARGPTMGLTSMCVCHQFCHLGLDSPLVLPALKCLSPTQKTAPTSSYPQCFYPLTDHQRHPLALRTNVGSSPFPMGEVPECAPSLSRYHNNFLRKKVSKWLCWV